ncbi:MAG: hypothetical protein KME01_01345 [Chroococcus sp. CMT-3BRIN-NPC107]|jgi:hypothetical protein|nr:hypothetical protein [Chroococcus sp. CMT-3BRIN-NPC107]
MNLQNLGYTINNLSPRQKMAALAVIVGASAVISTIALSQRQSSQTTTDQVSDRALPSTSSNPLDPTNAVPDATGNLDTTLTPGIVPLPSENATSRFNNGIGTSPESNSNIDSSSATQDRNSSLGRNRIIDNLNSANPNIITTAPSSSPTTTLPRQVYVPALPSPSIAPSSPLIPRGTSSPNQNFTTPSVGTSPVAPAIPPESPTVTSPSDTSLPPSVTENTPTFDSRTGTYTTTPREPTSSPGSLSSPSGSLSSPTSNDSNFGNSNFSRPSGGSSNPNPTSPIYGSSNGTSSSNPIYNNPNGNANSTSIYGNPNGGSTSNTSPNGITP